MDEIYHDICTLRYIHLMLYVVSEVGNGGWGSRRSRGGGKIGAHRNFSRGGKPPTCRMGQLTRTSTSRRDAAADKSPKSRLTRTLIDASTSLRYEMDTIRRLAGGLKLGGAGTKHEVTAGGEALGVV